MPAFPLALVLTLAGVALAVGGILVVVLYLTSKTRTIRRSEDGAAAAFEQSVLDGLRAAEAQEAAPAEGSVAEPAFSGPLTQPSSPSETGIPAGGREPTAFAEIAQAADQGDKVALAVQQLNAGGALDLVEEALPLSEDLPPGRYVLLKDRKRALVLPPGTPAALIERYRKSADCLILFHGDQTPFLCRPLSEYVTDALFPDR